MTVQNIASVALLVPMIVMVRFRAAVLRKRGVRGIPDGRNPTKDYLSFDEKLQIRRKYYAVFTVDNRIPC